MKIEDNAQYRSQSVDTVNYGEVVDFDGEYYIVWEAASDTIDHDRTMLINLRNGRCIDVSDKTKVIPVDATLKIVKKGAVQ